MKWTETLQLGKRVLKMPLLALGTIKMSPVHALYRMFHTIPREGNGPAFCDNNKNAVPYQFYLKFLKEMIILKVLNPSNSTCHHLQEEELHGPTKQWCQSS